MTLLAFASVNLLTADQKDNKGQQGRQPKPALAEQARDRQPAPIDVGPLFEDFDTNKDGFLDRNEAPAFLRSHFDKLDTNKDGRLSREEVIHGFALWQPQRRPSDLLSVLIEMSDCDEGCTQEIQFAYDALRKLDKNHDGKIDADEIKAGREQLVKERVDSIFKDLDRNQDGRISREEARGQLKRHFADIDRNNDGFIDRDELTHAAAQRPLTPGAPANPAALPRSQQERQQGR